MGILIVAIFLVAGVSTVFATNKENKSVNGVGIPNFGPGVLDEVKENPNVIDTYGKVPKFETYSKRKEWLNTLNKIADNVRDENNFIDSYFYPKWSNNLVWLQL